MPFIDCLECPKRQLKKQGSLVNGNDACCQSHELLINSQCIILFENTTCHENSEFHMYYFTALPDQKKYYTFEILCLVVCTSSDSPLFQHQGEGILKRNKLASQFLFSVQRPSCQIQPTFIMQIHWTSACNSTFMKLFIHTNQQPSENTQMTDYLLNDSFTQLCFRTKPYVPHGGLPPSSNISSCNNERQNKLYVSCDKIHTLHPSLFPDISPAQNILAVIIPYVE